jgi:hypothetical protein
MLIYDPFFRKYGKLQIFALFSHVHSFGQQPKPKFTLASSLQNQENSQAALNYTIHQ